MLGSSWQHRMKEHIRACRSGLLILHIRIDVHLSLCSAFSLHLYVTLVLLLSTGGAVVAAAAPPPASSTAAAAASPPEAGPSMPAYYLVKWITWKEKKTPIITQSENGPCPLLAIMNTLFLRWKVKCLIWSNVTASVV